MQRLLIVSNRLPINVSKDKKENEWKFQLSSGGLVSALAGVQKSTKFLWIGWPGNREIYLKLFRFTCLGIDVDIEERKSFSDILYSEHSAMPVFVDQKTSDLHYNGFSNRYSNAFFAYNFIFSTIWPLFHYLSADININEDYWEGYKRTNEIFADAIAEVALDGDMIWIHDYHLMLLPEMLRLAMKKLKKSVRIGFFLHIPFPTSEVFRYGFNIISTENFILVEFCLIEKKFLKEF
jgi:trehalose-6-phosphate synthase